MTRDIGGEDISAAAVAAIGCIERAGQAAPEAVDAG